jgi:ribosomal protein S18 acetylase RimI-like enzyme
MEADDADVAKRQTLEALGFAVNRREHHYIVPTDALARSGVLTAFTLTSAAEADLDRLRELDDQLRQDVPGADGWRNDPATFADQVFGDSGFDPETYLVAVDADAGAYNGLVRVWIRTPRPRLGLIGVLPDFRRRGLAMALLGQAFGVVRVRGVPEVECEVDETNVASNALMRALGARRVGGSIELVPPSVDAAQSPPIRVQGGLNDLA